MNMKRRLFVLALAGLTFSESWAQTVTLDQAVQEALAGGTDQAVWAANLEGSRTNFAVAQARAGLTLSTSLQYGATKTVSDPTKTTDDILPQNAVAGLTLGSPLTSVTARVTQNFQTAPSGPSSVSQVGSVNLTQILWNGYPGGTAQATLEKAALTLKTAEWNAQVNRNKLVLAVKQAFFTLLSAQESVVQLTFSLTQRQESLKFAQTRFDLGQATSLDLKQAKINTRTAELDLQAGRSTLDTARRRLANLLGRQDSEGLVVAAQVAPEVGVASLEEAISLALSERVEPQIAQANARSAQIDAEVALGSATPGVNLTSGLSFTRDQVTSKNSLVGTLGFTVSAPLIDGGLAVAQQTLAKVQKTVAQTQYEQLLRTVPVDVSEAWNTWQINQGRLEVSTAALEVAEGQRLVVQAQFDAGLKTLTDLQTSDITLSTAQLNLLKAKITAQLSALSLLSLMGR